MVLSYNSYRDNNQYFRGDTTMSFKKFKYKRFFWATILIVTFIICCGVGYVHKTEEIKSISYNEFIEKVSNHQVSKVTISSSPTIKINLKDDKAIYVTDNPRTLDFKEFLLLNNIKVEEGTYTSTISILQGILGIAVFSFFGFFIIKSTRKENSKATMGMNMVEASEENCNKFRLHNIAGNEEAKENVFDLIDFIKNSEKYSKYGARMPRGIIFYGPPGTGKTLMAKAIAGEAGVPFYAVSGSDFVQMYVGVGASRVRDLFKKARESKKAVIFIDEIDALGKRRSSSVVAGNDERDQTLNALLTEMSGFSSEEGIIVIAATNRLDTLDEALLRPGRFDRQVEIGLPDIKGRERILNHHAKNKPLSEEVNLNKVAKETIFFSGAMLENLLNESAINAVKRSDEAIKKEDIDKAFYTVLAGSEKKDRSNIRENDRKITAYHESGHALIAKLVAPENTVAKVTIIPSTKGAGGFCINIPPDKMYYTKKEIESQIMVNLAGRAAEELIFGKDMVTTGASNDIEKATSIIKDYVLKYGMSEKTGLINLNAFNSQKNINDNILVECKEHLFSLYEETKKVLMNNMDFLHKIAGELLQKEILCEEELDSIMQAS